MKRTIFSIFLSFLTVALLWGQDDGLKLPPSPPPQVSTPAATETGNEGIKLPASPPPYRTTPPAPKPDFSSLRLQGGQAPPLFELRDFSGGLNLKAQPNAVADNEALELNNFLFEIDGGLKVRPGFSKVNSTVIDLSPIAGLYHYSIPNYGKGFLVADSTYIYKMTDAGTFADSQIYFPITIRMPTGTSIATVITPTDNWLLEKLAFLRYEVLLRDGTDQETLNVRYLAWNGDSSAYQITFSANANPTINTSTTTSYLRYRMSNADAGGSIMSNLAAVQRNNTVYLATAGQRAVKWNGKMQGSVGFYAQGLIDTVKGLAGTKRDTQAVCNSCNFSSNELAGKILVTYGKDGGTPANWIRMFKIVDSNTTHSIFFAETDSNFSGSTPSIPTTSSIPFTVWNPIFTVVDSGTIDTVRQGTSAELGITYLVDNNGAFNNSEVGARLIEFLNGPAAGLQVVLRYPITSTILSVYQRNGLAYPQNSRPRPGDKYAIWDVGLSARYLELYYDRLVAAGLDFFPNTIRYSEAADPDGFSAANYTTLPEQGGDSVTFLANLAGRLIVGQKYRLWMLVGNPPWTGNTVVLASDGIGCVAPRSVIKNGEYFYFVGLNSGIPTVFRWQVGALTFNTAGTPSLIGERGLVPLTQKIDTLMKRVNKAYLSKATAGLYQNHLLVSLPFSPDTNNSGTIAINLLTGAVAQESFFAGLMHNGTAAGDSGQLYFTHDSIGQVLLFNGATDNLDTGKTFRASFQSKWFDFGQPTVLKQGLRWWAQYYRADSTADTARWIALTDFATTRQDSLIVSGSLGAATSERELNGYMKVGVLGKRLGFRFDGWGPRGNFRLDALRVQLSLRGTAP